ncbi:ankyrin repeat domain-containing protein [Cellulophaga baltica]|uniref:Ankyrin repeat n=1 Tax=Cellulophaga baltica TaxID=76594 RepID=A0A1G7LTD6_9FLAO|nr:ankyrin repeat domain-containing protein [Cellulophaga baltica]SDF52808.1 Ankyrin repeat [Cellulophaga baltica]
MGIFKKLFGGNSKKSPKEEENKTSEYDLKWISADQNPWNLKILDLRPISQTMLSTSKDPKMATNAVSYSQEDGTTFKDYQPQSEKTIFSNLVISIDEKLEEGVLFNPSTMENKWAIYFMNNRLIFIRSWLREAFVVAKTVQENNQLKVTEIKGEFTNNESPEMTQSILMFLLFSHSLNETVPAPIPKDLEDNTDKAGMWAFSTYGNMAHLGYFGEDFNYQTDLKLRTHSLLHIAIARGDLNKINEQLDKSTNVNCLAGDGLSTLQWAMTADSNVLSLLLDKGANPNTRSTEGATPIMNAVQSDKIEHLNILIKNQADLNAKDDRGFTALHRASEMGRKEMVRILLENGANKNVEAENHTPLSLAIAMKNEEIIKLLEK